jgi:response regulator NasT
VEQQRKRIVIADDEALIRRDLSEMLTNLGYLVVGEAGDGRTAVNIARERKPDLVIMDIRMPDMDGIDAAKTLTEEGVAPVLLLSAYSQRDLVERAAEAGVSGYVIKPFDESNFRSTRSSAATSRSLRKGWQRASPSTVPRES